MPDPRFYETLAPATLEELAALAGATLVDPSAAGRLVSQVGILGRADGASITFLADRKHAGALADSRAGACFLRLADADFAPKGCAALTVKGPQSAYARAAERLHRPRRHEAGSPAIHPEAELEDDVETGHGVVIGPGAQIGRGTRIAAGAVIGPGVAIGRDCRIGSNAVIGFALIGDRVKIYANAVIGESGFGAAVDVDGMIDVPQLGRVILQDNVTIGAVSCVDRGAYDDTIVGENTKIDNLVQIAHNVVVGRNCVMAAHTGISGSVIIGDWAMFGGRAGVADHLTVGEGAKLGPATGAIRDVPAGDYVFGTPARPLRQAMREFAWLARKAAERKQGGES